MGEGERDDGGEGDGVSEFIYYTMPGKVLTSEPSRELISIIPFYRVMPY